MAFKMTGWSAFKHPHDRDVNHTQEWHDKNDEAIKKRDEKGAINYDVVKKGPPSLSDWKQWLKDGEVTQEDFDEFVRDLEAEKNK